MIAAVASNGVIGHDGGLPWYLPDDLRQFRRLTTGHVVVVGRCTHDSIVRRLGRPLPDRVSIVVSRQAKPDEDTVRYRSAVKAALAEAWDVEKSLGGAEVFVIGGAAIYEAALSEVDYAYLTQVYAEPDGDARMPAGWLEGFQRVRAGDRQPAHDRQPAYSFEEYERT